MRSTQLRILIWGINESKTLMENMCQECLDTAQWQGIKTDFLGIGHQFKEHKQRLWILRDELRRMDQNVVVLCMDGSDTLFNGNQHEILQKFLTFETNILVSAERDYTHQYPRYKEYFDKLPGPYKYVNAGTFIGYARALLSLFNDLIELVDTYPHANDQGLLGIWLSRNMGDQELVRMDHYCELFWVTTSDYRKLGELADDYSTIYNPYTQYKPAILHVTGNQDPTIAKVYNQTYNCLKHINSINHHRIIILSPVIQDDNYKLWKRKKHEIDNDYPSWYTVRHPNILMFFYGARENTQENVLNTDYVEEAVLILEERYFFDYIVHVPEGYSINPDELYLDIVKNSATTLLKEGQKSDFVTDQRFIYHCAQYFPYTGLNREPYIDSPRHDRKPYEVIDNWVEPISIGGWCGPALALNDLKIRKVAYPFCFIHSTLSCIHAMINQDFEDFYKVGESTLFPHHNIDKKEEKKQFDDRIDKFVKRLYNPQPLLFIRTVISQDYYESLKNIRLIKWELQMKYNRTDKFLLILHDQGTRTVKLGMPDKDIMLWAAEGKVGWNIPDRDTIFDSYARIVQYALNEHNWKIDSPHYKSHNIKNHNSWGICKELYPI